MMEKEKMLVAYGEIISKCWEDESYKKEFVQDPETKMLEAGITLEEGVTYKVIEAPKMSQYLVLPHEDTKNAVQEIAKSFLNKSEKSNVIIPAGFEIRIIQDTEDTRYLILPASPKTLTAAELSMVTGGESTAVKTDLEVAVTGVVAQTVLVGTTTVGGAEVIAACVVALI